MKTFLFTLFILLGLLFVAYYFALAHETGDKTQACAECKDTPAINYDEFHAKLNDIHKKVQENNQQIQQMSDEISKLLDEVKKQGRMLRSNMLFPYTYEDEVMLHWKDKEKEYQTELNN
jgi:uncharacterized coiled-coil DUF342 family protein